MTGPSALTLVCASERRRDLLRTATGPDGPFNGIDFVEVGDDGATLCVHLLGPLPTELDEDNVVITGGRRVRELKALRVRPRPAPDPDGDDCLEVVLDRRPDGSTYTLCLVASDDVGRPVEPRRPPHGFDPRYACAPFGRPDLCPADVDCAPVDACPPEVAEPPLVDYLAKDYESFRRLLLDRLARDVPGWTERHVPDVMLTLVELLAFVGDRLSYYQDAVGTETYLATSRQRISVRRHARLVDYRLHEGQNARAFVHLRVDGDLDLDENCAFATAAPGGPAPGRALTWEDFSGIDPDAYVVFEPLLPTATMALRPAHNEIRIWTWGDRECCLPEGATTVTLADGECIGPMPEPPDETPPDECPPGTDEATNDAADGEGGPPPPQPERTLDLRVGDLLLFEERLGPSTGLEIDADPSRRHVVRVTRVEAGIDPLFGQAVLDVWWSEEDALPFPLCVTTTGPAPACRPLTDVSVAGANVVLADHGRTVCEPVEPPVSDPDPEEVCEGECAPAETSSPLRPYRPGPLSQPDLTYAAPVEWWRGERPVAASALVRQAPHDAVPALRLAAVRRPFDTASGCAPGPDCRSELRAACAAWWHVAPDLLASGPDDRHVVVEVDDRRRAHLRFGDDELGEAPEPGARFVADYRVGNGEAGNVGADRIVHAVLSADSLATSAASQVLVRNPFPAAGGAEPEPIDDAKLLAPAAFRSRLERAITAADYSALAERVGGADVQRAASDLRWTGSWHEARVGIDQRGTAQAGADLLAAIGEGLDPYRRLGHDLVVGPAVPVPLDVRLLVCVAPHHLRSEVRAAVADVVTSGYGRDGRPGFFHPDQLTFGEDLRLSRLVAAVSAVEGVSAVEVLAAHRMGGPVGSEIADGYVPIGPLEVARLDNDPEAPENGRLELVVEGGR